jgi:serine/threonine-protein kinase
VSQHPSLEEEFEIGRELGRGGFGLVLAGRRRRDGAAVAVKLPRQELAPEEEARVDREARLLRSLASPHLAGFHGLYLDAQGQLALVYDLVPGQDLGARSRGQPPGRAEVQRWVGDVAAGLTTLHEAGLVHRDVKPENVQVTPEGRAVLLDFGMLRPTTGETVTATGMVLGTPEFLAPEQVEGTRAGAPADVYALGCLAYELLEGRPPYRGGIEEVLVRKLRDPPPPPRTPLGQAAWGVLESALARDPSVRPTARELARLLPEALREAPAGATPPTLAGAQEERLRETRLRRRRSSRSRQPSARSGRRARRQVRTRLLVGLFMAVAVGTFFLTPPRKRPPPLPSPPAPAPPPPSDQQAFLDDLTRELEWARGAYVDEAGKLIPSGTDLSADGVAPLLEPDPGRFHLVERHMPKLSTCFQWLQVGEQLPHELPEDLRTAVREYEDRFASAGMPRPFYPALELTPASEPYVVPDPLREFLAERVFPEEAERLPEAVTGWAAVAARELWDLQQAFAELQDRTVDQLRRAVTPPGLPGLRPAYLRLRSHQNFERFIREVGDLPEVRSQLLAWHRPLQRAFLRVLLATGRSSEAREPGSRALAILVRERLRDWSVFQPIALRPGPPELLVGGRLSVPATRVLLAGLLENLNVLRTEWQVTRDPAQGLRRKLLEDAPLVPPPEGDSVDTLLFMRLNELAGLYDELGEYAPLAELYRHWRSHLRRIPPRIGRELVVRLGRAHLDEPALHPEELPGLVREAEALAEALGDDIRGGSKLARVIRRLREHLAARELR